MKRYPRTFLQLVTWGQAFILLPLLIAAAYVIFGLQTLDERYRATIDLVSLHVRLGSELSEDLVHMEKNLLRYEVLRDTETFNDYGSARTEWWGIVDEFAQKSSLPASMISDLQQQVALEAAAYEDWQNTGSTEKMHEAFEAIRPRATEVLEKAAVFLESEKGHFFGDLHALRLRLLAASVLAALLTFVLLWSIRHLLSRLISHFEVAVLRLGKGDLQHSIALDGPNDLRWLGRWLEWLRRRLLSLENARTQVLRHVSHELKTPLAAMNEGAALLEEEIAGPLTPEQRRIVGIIQNNAHRLQDLIEGLLQLQRAGHAAERIGYQTLRYDQLIRQVLDTCELLAAERGISFSCVLPEVEIMAGREALMTIVHNLLSNAIKFSPNQGQITVTLCSDDENAILDVIDQGCGVASEDASAIFEPFFRAATSRDIPGVGLGLAITREFVLAHRGELQLVPTPCGAHFRVSLPLHAKYLRKLDHA